MTAGTERHDRVVGRGRRVELALARELQSGSKAIFQWRVRIGRRELVGHWTGREVGDWQLNATRRGTPAKLSSHCTEPSASNSHALNPMIAFLASKKAKS